MVAGSKSRLKQGAVSGDPAALIAKLVALSANGKRERPRCSTAIALKAKKGFDGEKLVFASKSL